MIFVQTQETIPARYHKEWVFVVIETSDNITFIIKKN